MTYFPDVGKLRLEAAEKVRTTYALYVGITLGEICPVTRLPLLHSSIERLRCEVGSLHVRVGRNTIERVLQLDRTTLLPFNSCNLVYNITTKGYFCRRYLHLLKCSTESAHKVNIKIFMVRGNWGVEFQTLFIVGDHLTEADIEKKVSNVGNYDLQFFFTYWNKKRMNNKWNTQMYLIAWICWTLLLLSFKCTGRGLRETKKDPCLAKEEGGERVNDVGEEIRRGTGRPN